MTIHGSLLGKWSATPAYRRPRRVLGLLMLGMGMGSACAVHQSDSQGPATMMITQDEIDSCHAASAFDAVNRLRPLFLAGRGKLSIGAGTPVAMPNVYVDNQFYGDVSVLQNIAAGTIESIRFYNASDAQFKYGRGNEAGVIGIFTKH